MQQRKDFESTITELKKRIETVVVHSKEQDAKIQRVNTHVEMSKVAPQIQKVGAQIEICQRAPKVTVNNP